MKEPFLKPLAIVEQLHLHGFEAFFVGGSVRDLLLQREIGDIDIATSARPKEVIGLFPRTVDVGAKHGTIIVIYEGSMYEVTTFRSEENYNDFRRPDNVTFIHSLEEDLKRRDFTMNAIAMNHKGEIIDPFNGVEAINKRIIQTVGKPSERFSEDALRMLRAVRFVSQLDFSVVEETKTAIAKHSHLLDKISVERMTVELEKVMRGQNTTSAFKLLIETEMYKYLPGLLEKRERVEKLALYDWSNFKERPEYWTLLAYVIELKDIETFLRLWRLPNKIIRAVEININGLIKVLDSGWTNQLLYQLGLDRALQVQRVYAVLTSQDPKQLNETVRTLFSLLPIKSRDELVVRGKDLLYWFNKTPGPWVSKLIETIEDNIIKGNVVNDKAVIKEWLDHCNLK